MLPLFFATGSACHFGSSCPLLPFPYLPPSTLPSSPFSTLPIGPASHWLVPPLLHLSYIPCSHLYTLSLSRPGLSLWQVPPGLLPPSPTSLSLSCSHIHHCYLPLYPLTTSFILARLVIEIGPALSLPLFIYLPPISTPPSYRLHFSLIYPCYYISSGPACHCGRSRPPPPLSNTFQHLLPLHPPNITFPLIHLPLRYTVARLVIVAGPAISSYPCTSLTPPSPALPPTNISLPAHSTSSPSYRPCLPLWLVSPFPYTYSSSLLYTHTSSPPIPPFAPWPGLPLW